MKFNVFIYLCRGFLLFITAMNKTLCFLLLMLTCLVPGKAAASDKLEDVVSDILKLRMTPDEVADSAFRYLYMYFVEHPGELYEELEEAYAHQVIPYAESNAVNKSRLSHYYDELAQTQLRQGKSRFADSKSNYNKALAYAVEAGDYFRQGRALEHLSLIESKYGDIVEGYDLAQKAIEAYKKSDRDADKFVIRCYYYQAANYLQLNDTDGLAKVIDMMKSFTDEVKAENLNFLLYNIYSVEEVYYGLLSRTTTVKERQKYIELNNQASLNTIRLLESADPEYWKGTSINMSWNYYNRAVLFVNSYDKPPMDSVRYYLDKALAITHENKIDDIREVQLSASYVLAEVWMKNGNYPKAKEILLDAMDQLQPTEGINNIIIDKIEIYKNLTEIARQSRQYEDALAYSDSINSLEKQRFSLDQAKAIKDLEIKYQTKETELALAQSEMRRANTLIWFFAAIGLLLIAIAVFIIYAVIQSRRRMQREVEFANLRADIGRKLTQQYVEGLENERRRMSQELHDGVCNDLLAIQMNLSAGKPIESAAALIENCRDSLRRISHELMPPEFAYASLDEVIRFFVAKQAEANEGKIRFAYSSDDANWASVPDNVALEVYRVVQEAVGNAVKHAEASTITVSLNPNDDCLSVEIADNGIYKQGGRKGLGVESIRRRARSVNGTIELIANENSGTKVILNVKIGSIQSRLQ